MEGKKARGGGGGRRKMRGEKWEEAVRRVLSTLKMMCLKGNVPSSTRDLVSWP